MESDHEAIKISGCDMYPLIRITRKRDVYRCR